MCNSEMLRLLFLEIRLNSWLILFICRKPYKKLWVNAWHLIYKSKDILGRIKNSYSISKNKPNLGISHFQEPHWIFNQTEHEYC